MTTSTSASLSATSTTGLGLSGLSSGLDTSGIISKLMSIESQPQTLLQNQLSNVTTYRSALQSVNTQLAAIATAAKTASTAGALNAFTASSDTGGITPAADATATAGSVSFTVSSIATAQVSVGGAMTAWPDTSSSTPAITITTGSGPTAKSTTVHALSSNLDDVVAAINGGSTGVTATKIAAGTDANGVAQYRLQFRSSSTGAAGAFAVYEGEDATAPVLPTTTVATASDASITLYGGTAAEQTLTSPSNTFTALMTGVNVTVSATTTAPATITVKPDSSKAASTAATLTGNLIALFSTIATDSAVTTSASTSGGASSSSTTGSVFTGDTGIRALNDQMLSAATDPVTVNGAMVSPSSIGITLTKTGTITFDQSAFTSAMASDPAGTMSMFQTIAGRISDAATAASDPLTGTLTQKITSEQSQESSLNGQISDWTTRLATIQQNYQTQFNAMELALNSLSSQASWLTSQINTLPSYSSSTSKNG
jgi:flagellar hook-associated protein 2